MTKDDFIIVSSADEMYKEMIGLIKKGSIETKPRDQKIKERIGISIRNINPRNRIITEKNRKFPLKGAMAEFLWYMSGNPSIKAITPYLKHWEHYSDDGEIVNSNYGFRWADQLPKIIEKIKKDKDTRQAVVTLYHPDYADYYGKDTVCTPSFQFFIRNGMLTLIVNARSRDIIRGECIDQFTFSLLQEIVANELGVEVGYYQVNIGSLHIYEEHWNLLESPMEFDTSIKGDISHRTRLHYSSFWDQVMKLKDTEYSEEDFILSISNNKGIDLGAFNDWKEKRIHKPDLSPRHYIEKDIFP